MKIAKSLLRKTIGNKDRIKSIKHKTEIEVFERMICWRSSISFGPNNLAVWPLANFSPAIWRFLDALCSNSDIYAFKKRLAGVIMVKNVFAVIATTERSLYANVILTKGVIPPT